MNTDKIEALYNVIDKSTDLMMDKLKIEYLDALIETGDNINSGEVHVEDNLPDSKTKLELEKMYQTVKIDDYSAEEIRQTIQLALIKANKVEKLQANHQFTPDSIGMLMSYLLAAINKDNHQQLTILDPTVGTGNLLATIVNNLAKENIKTVNYGVDNDDTLLAVASMLFALLKVDVDLYHQDILDTVYVKDVDVVVSDLPVGYYPIDDRVKSFETRSNQGHSFVHHLIIERAMTTLKEGGIGLFVVPTDLFQTEEAKKLLSYMHGKIYLQAMLTLPKKLFKDKNSQKSILVLQKAGAKSKQADEVLLGDLPEFNQPAQLQKFLTEFSEWSMQSIKF